MNFYDIITELCTQKGISPDRLCKDLGLSNATATKWKQGAEPRNSTKKAIADYFMVSVEYLSNGAASSGQKENSSLTDERVKIAMDHINGLSKEELDVIIPLLEQMKKAKQEKQ